MKGWGERRGKGRKRREKGGEKDRKGHGRGKEGKDSGKEEVKEREGEMYGEGDGKEK